MKQIFLLTITVFAYLLAKGQDTLVQKIDTAGCIDNFAEYRDFYLQKRYAEAVKAWRYTFLHCSNASENIYIDGAVLLDYMIREEKDSLHREKLIDTLMMLYDIRIKHFGKEGFLLGRKGVDRLQRRPWEFDLAFADLQRSVQNQWVNSRPPVLVNYFAATIMMLANGRIDSSDMFSVYNEINNIFRHNIKKRTTDSEAYQKASDDVDRAYRKIAPCFDLEERYIDEYYADTANVRLFSTIVSEFEKNNCQYSRFYWYILQKKYEADSSPELALSMAKLYARVMQVGLAKRYAFKATGSTDREVAMQGYLLASEMQYKYFDFPPGAIDMAEKAVKLDSLDPRPYVLLGDIYIAIAPQCAVNKIEEAANYWLAMDVYRKAAELKPSLAAEMEEKIRACYPNIPSREQLMMQNLKEGDPFLIKCVIKKTTTIKCRP